MATSVPVTSRIANATHFHARNWPITCETGTLRIVFPKTRRLPITTVPPKRAMLIT